MALSTLIWNYVLEVSIGLYKLEARAQTPEWLSWVENAPLDNWGHAEKEGTCTGWAGAKSNWRIAVSFVLLIKSKTMYGPSEVITGIALKTYLCNICFTLNILSFPNPHLHINYFYLKLSFLGLLQNSPLENSHCPWPVEGLVYSGAISFLGPEVDNTMQKLGWRNTFFSLSSFPSTNSCPSCFDLPECAYLQMKIAKDTAGLIKM